MNLTPGQKFVENFTITAEQIEEFAAYSGDKQPIHVDDEKAKKTIFRQKIAHGLLMLLPLTRILGMNLPESDEYVIFRRLSLEFRIPVFVGDNISLELNLVSEIKKDNFQFSAAWKKGENVIASAEIVLVIKKYRGLS